MVILDERGRYRAQQVSYLKASQVFEHKPNLQLRSLLNVGQRCKLVL
jgi:hypothetical protein